MLFFNKNKNKIIVFNHIFGYSNPLKGWIHNCFLCDTLSSREQNYNKSSKYFVIVCKDCKKKFEDKTYADIENFILKKKL